MARLRDWTGIVTDITAPEHGVEIQIRNDGKVIWVHVDGVTVLRICQIPELRISDAR